MTALDDLCTEPFHDAGPALRARILSRLADTELTVALVAEPQDEVIELRRFAVEGGKVALAFDGDDRLAGFVGAACPYAAMPGRVLAGLLRAEGIGLLVNPGLPSQMMLDAAALDWLAEALAPSPLADEAAQMTLAAPSPAAVAALAEPLGERLSDLRGLIASAALVGSGSGHLLIIGGADAAHQPAIAKALAEALAFLPPVEGGVDIAFSDRTAPGFALRFDLPAPEPDAPPVKPKGPPILR